MGDILAFMGLPHDPKVLRAAQAQSRADQEFRQDLAVCAAGLTVLAIGGLARLLSNRPSGGKKADGSDPSP